MEKIVLNWMLLTTTILIFGKALNLIEIDWFWAFFPFTFTVAGSMVLLLITSNRDGKE